MTYAAEELKTRLLQHLDGENNVINERGALEAIALWEKYPITKEILERTRVGRHVNELRKRTTNQELARRAKNLVRKWQSAANSPSGTLHQSSSSPALVANGSFLHNHQLQDEKTKAAGTPGQKSLSNAASSPLSSPTLIRTELKLKIHTNSAGVAIIKNEDSGSRENSRSSSIASDSSRSKPNSPALSNYAPRMASPLTLPTTGSASTVNQLQRTLVDTKMHPPPFTRGNSTSPMLNTAQNDIKESRTKASFTLPVSSVTNSKILKSTFNETASSPDATTHQDYGPSKNRTANNHHMQASPAVAIVYDNGRKRRAENSFMITSKSSDFVGDEGSSAKRSKRDSGISSETIQASTSVTNSFSNNHRVSPLRIVRNVVETVRSNSASDDDLSRDSYIVQGHSAAEPIDSDNAVQGAKAPKVSTTAELINKLHMNGSLRLVRSETIERIANNQITRECDDINRSVVQDGAKPRPHKSRHVPEPLVQPPAMSAGGLAQVKTEMVHKFLQMSVESSASPPVSSPANGLMRLLDRLEPEPLLPVAITSPPPVRTKIRRVKNGAATTTADNLEMTQTAFTLAEGSSNVTSHISQSLPGGRGELSGYEIDPWSLLPPLDPAFVDDDIDSHDSQPPVLRRECVTNDDVTILHNEQVPGVNGLFDFRNEWRDWTCSITLQTYDSNVLHILPYVNVDD